VSAYLILSYILGVLACGVYAAWEEASNPARAGRNMIRAASLLPLAPLLMPLLALVGLGMLISAVFWAWRDE